VKTRHEPVKYPLDPPVVELSHWGLVAVPGGTALTGSCRGHPRFQDGEEITTSRVVGQRAGMVLTHNTLYLLTGGPHPTYEARFPGLTLPRLLEQLSCLP
jgi:hypothetical protein